MTIATVGIDLAKNVFAVHAVGKNGLVELKRPEVRRAKLLELVASWPPCVIGMETCSGAHHWAREFERLGHTVRLMAPKFVAPYRMAGKRGKNDANEALLHKSEGRRDYPSPRRSYAMAPTGTVLGRPSWVKRLSRATRTCNSTT